MQTLQERPRPPAFPLAALVLVAANLVPLAGALFWGWSVREIVGLYWAENLIVGLFAFFRILLASAPSLVNEFLPEPARRAAPGFRVVANLGVAGFFAVHYGIFCLVHGFFVFTLLGQDTGPRPSEPLWILLGLFGLLVSHAVSFVRNYLLPGEFRRTTPQSQMFAPYPRIVVLHLTILFGAFAIQSLGSPVYLLAILVAGKTLLELVLRRFRPGGKAASAQPSK